MRFLGMTEGGVYTNDEFEGIHPDVLQQYYGTTQNGVHRQSHQTGAGNPVEENDPDVSGPEEEDPVNDLGARIAQDQEHHIRHDPIPVPDHASPFGELEHIFRTGLQELEESGYIPDGYGIREDEWEDGEYPSFEILKTGRKRKELRVSLPDHIWRRRAQKWVRGLDAMRGMMQILEDNNDT